MYFNTFPAFIFLSLLALSQQKVLDLSDTVDLTKQDQRQMLPRSVNLSFFVPAFSLFALASQWMPQMFPSLTSTTSSKRSKQRSNRVRREEHLDWGNLIPNVLQTLRD